ncbi:hypothetical protein ACIHQR_11025 [Corallococcus coralloides]
MTDGHGTCITLAPVTITWPDGSSVATWLLRPTDSPPVARQTRVYGS